MENFINAPWLFNRFRSNSYYVPDWVISRIKAMAPDGIRFMGGTLGNRYDSLKPGYGHEETQATENYLSRAAYMISQLPGVKVSYVVNVYQALMGGDVNYWIDNTLNVLSKMPSIAYCEIGNEINTDGKYMSVGVKPSLFQSRDKYTSIVKSKADRYLSISESFISAIRKQRPDVLIGLPMGNYENLTLGCKIWNAELRQYTGHDYEIFHIYMKSKTMEDIVINLDRCIGGAQKPVHITEWSWEHGNSDSYVKNSEDIGKDYYNAFFERFPAACNLFEVKMICRHQLAGSNVYSLIKL